MEFTMTVFLLFLSSVLVFHPTSSVMSDEDSRFTPYSHVTKYTANRPQLNKQKNSKAGVVLSSSSNFVNTNNGSEITRFSPHTQTTGSVTTPQLHSFANSGGHGRSDFNDFVHADIVDIMSSSGSLKRAERRAIVQTPTLLANFSDNSSKEVTEKNMRSLPSSNHEGDGVQEVSSDDSSSDYPEMYLKLDKNYTPKEIAEYILSTGDEKGITQVISDMVQEGQIMASRDDVILFLEAVQRVLDKLKRLNHETSLPHPPTSKESRLSHFNAGNVKNSPQNYFLKAKISMRDASHPNTRRTSKRKTKNHHH